MPISFFHACHSFVRFTVQIELYKKEFQKSEPQLRTYVRTCARRETIYARDFFH